MASNVTLVIPTFNRLPFIVRQLEYYQQSGYSGYLLIADSSDINIFQETSNLIGLYFKKLSIRHHHVPNLSFAQAIQEVSNQVTTSYVAVIPDDDFLIPSGIDRCIHYLDKDSRFVAAHGLGVLIASKDGKSDSITNVSYYPQPVIYEKSATERVNMFLKNYLVTLFSVHRTEIWIKSFAQTPSKSKDPLCCDRSFSDELLQCTLLAAYGNVAEVEGLYLVRQTHEDRNFLPGYFNWVTSEKWRPSYLWFRSKVAEAVSKVDNIPLADANNIVETAFKEYFQKCQYSQQPNPKTFAKFLRYCIPDILYPILRRISWRISYKSIRLEGLMNPSMPYYEEFLLIYKIVNRKI